MPAGTITLTSGSTDVTGTGTNFATELKVNDLVVAVVGGVTYTLGVQAVGSATALTLTTAYDGPTTSGLAWTALPNAALVGITAQVAADVAKAIRGFNFDKVNWQKVFSSDTSVTVTLPDLTKFTGPSWGYIADQFNGFQSSLDEKANKSDLGNSSSKDVGTASGTVAAGDDSRIMGALQKSGGTISGALAMGGNNITGLGSLSFATAALLNSTLSNMGFTSPATNRFVVATSTRNYIVLVHSAVVTLNTSGETTITYPAAFPTACMVCIPVLGDSTGATSCWIINYSTTRNTSFDIHVKDQVSSACRINFIAIGY